MILVCIHLLCIWLISKLNLCSAYFDCLLGTTTDISSVLSILKMIWKPNYIDFFSNKELSFHTLHALEVLLVSLNLLWHIFFFWLSHPWNCKVLFVLFIKPVPLTFYKVCSPHYFILLLRPIPWPLSLKACEVTLSNHSFKYNQISIQEIPSCQTKI